MPINTADISFALAKETVPGQTPTTGNRLEVPVKVDQAPPIRTFAQIEDETKRPNREGNAAASGHAMSEWEVDMHMRGGAVMDLLIESALSGTFEDDNGKQVAKGSDKDTTFSVFSLLKAGVAGEAMEYVDAGCMVRSMAISASAKEGAEVQFSILGTNREENTTQSALPVTKTPAANTRHLYSDVQVDVDGQTLAFTRMEFSTEQERDLRVVLGEISASDIYTTGKRNTTLTLGAYRESFAVNELSNTSMPVVITIGSAGNGYKITIPAAKLLTPSDELDASGLLVNMEFNAGYDVETETGILIEKL